MDYKLGSEYRDVALRPEHLQASGLSANEVLELIDTLEGIAEPVMVWRKPRPLSPDPDDDMILDIAINGGADAIVTNNKKHFTSAAERFAISVLTPSEILQRIREGERDAE
jgi:predicted nucleic acid-binding protein